METSRQCNRQSRPTGVEPVSQAWEAWAQPLYHGRGLGRPVAQPRPDHILKPRFAVVQGRRRSTAFYARAGCPKQWEIFIGRLQVRVQRSRPAHQRTAPPGRTFHIRSDHHPQGIIMPCHKAVVIVAWGWLATSGLNASLAPARGRAARGTGAAVVRADRHDQLGDSLPAGAVARAGTVRLRHGGRINQVCFSPDGKLLATACHDHRVHFWDVTTGRERPRPAAVQTMGYTVAISSDGRTVATSVPWQILLCARGDRESLPNV